MRVALLALVTIVSVVLAAPASADPAHNIAAAKRIFLERMAQGKFDETRGLYAENFVQHGSSADATLEQDTDSVRQWRTAFPDLQIKIEHTVAQGDIVAVHWRMIGTNTVAAHGTPGEGRHVNVLGMSFFRFEKNRIAEEWTLYDVANLMTQLGL